MRAGSSVPPQGRAPEVAQAGGSAPGAGRERGPLGAFDHQLLRYAVVGAVNSVFAFSVFAGLLLAFGGRAHYLVLLLIAHVVGVLEAYSLQRWLVFRVSGRWWRELVRFWSVYLVALAVNMVALPLLVEVAHVPVLPAQAVVMLATTLGTFVAHRIFTFRRPMTLPTPTPTRT
jgi:putative flippase GtrA